MLLCLPALAAMIAALTVRSGDGHARTIG